MNDIEGRADKITDEFLELLMQEIKENPELTLERDLKEEDFKDKFPFNLEPPVKEEEEDFKKVIEPIKPSVKIEEKKKETKVDDVKTKFELQ